MQRFILGLNLCCPYFQFYLIFFLVQSPEFFSTVSWEKKGCFCGTFSIHYLQPSPPQSLRGSALPAAGCCRMSFHTLFCVWRHILTPVFRRVLEVLHDENKTFCAASRKHTLWYLLKLCIPAVTCCDFISGAEGKLMFWLGKNYENTEAADSFFKFFLWRIRMFGIFTRVFLVTLVLS